ncbi:MAG TPA: preprotein translocase subunit SecE [bacterium]|nr:preprotein translocase subunit SecE [bacterium]
MARASDGTTGPAIGKPVRTASGDRAATRPKASQARRVPQVFDVAIRFLLDVRAELKRVSWPDRQTLIASSVVVVFVLIVTALYLAGWDFVFAKIFEQILNR